MLSVVAYIKKDKWAGLDNHVINWKTMCDTIETGKR